MVWSENDFPTFPEELKIIRCNAISQLYLLLLGAPITPDKTVVSSGNLNPPF